MVAAADGSSTSATSESESDDDDDEDTVLGESLLVCILLYHIM